MNTHSKGKSWFGRIYAKVLDRLGLTTIHQPAPRKVPRTVGDYESLVNAEIKRGRKNAKRLHNQKAPEKGTTK